MQHSSPRLPYLFLSLVLLSYLGFGLFHISKFITADEHYWIYERIPQYWNALTEGKWKKTLINDKPGVTLALVSGPALLYDRNPQSLCYENKEHLTFCNHNRSEELLFFFRLPLLLFNFIILLYLFFVIRKISGEKIALLTTTFLALSPILLGITQIVNPDALLWSTSAASLFSFLALLVTREKKYIFLSGLFLSLAILSKYTASFLVPFFLFVSVLHPFIERGSEERKFFATHLKGNLIFFFGVFFGAFLIGSLLLPASWDSPLILLQLFWGGGAVFFPLSLLIFPGIFVFDILFFGSRITHGLWLILKKIYFFSTLEKALPLLLFVTFVSLIVGRAFFPDWMLFDKVPFDLKDLYNTDKTYRDFMPNFIESFILEINPLVFSVSPVVLFSFLFLCLDRTFKKVTGSINEFIVFSFFCFIPGFIVALIFSEILATARYLIMLYPIIAFLAALGLERLYTLVIAHYHSSSYKVYVGKAVFLSALLFSLVSLFTISPYYFNYTNFLLPEDKMIHHSWGYGGYEAAMYLNSLPHAAQMTIWSDYYGVCEFFVGRCMAIEYGPARTTSFDYVVLSARGKALYKPEHSRWLKPGNFYISPLYASTTPLWEIHIDGRPGNFVRVMPYRQ